MKKMTLGSFVAGSMALAASALAASPLLITTEEGLSTYTFDPDTGGVSTCYDGCARAWPPVLTTVREQAAPLGTTERKDGTLQLTYQGQPLYLYVGDAAPGDKTGDGLGGVWHLARP